MKAYIHTVGGKPFNDECEIAMRGFQKLGVECIQFSSNDVLDQANREDIVVGGLLVCEHALALRGIQPPSIDYPEQLKPFFGRHIWASTIGELREKTSRSLSNPNKKNSSQVALPITGKTSLTILPWATTSLSGAANQLSLLKSGDRLFAVANLSIQHAISQVSMKKGQILICCTLQ